MKAWLARALERTGEEELGRVVGGFQTVLFLFFVLVKSKQQDAFGGRSRECFGHSPPKMGE